MIIIILYINIYVYAKSHEYDSIAELWWKSKAAFIEAVNSPEGQKLCTVFLDDKAKFLDFSKSSAFFTKKYIIVE